MTSPEWPNIQLFARKKYGSDTTSDFLKSWEVLNLKHTKMELETPLFIQKPHVVAKAILLQKDAFCRYSL